MLRVHCLVNRRRPAARAAVLVLALVAAMLAAPRATAAAEPATRPPNVIVILADDLGIGDICAYGACDPGRSTPNIDALARTGARFTQAYAASPICSPSRAALLTGRYQQRFGHEFNPDGIDRGQRESLGTPLSEVLFPQHLKQRGYATGIVGKWHLGPAPSQHPVERGFDEFFGFLHGAKLFFPSLQEPGIHFIAEEPKKGKEKTEYNPLNPMMRGRDPIQEPDYLTDAFTREAVSFIERHRAEPFFLYVPYNAPHTPLQVDDERYQRFAAIADEGDRIHAAMMSALDDGVGAIVDALRRTGLLESTLVVFASDHGCPTNTLTCSNATLLGGKRILLEGGVRIPLIATWSGTIAPGRTIDSMVSLLDLLPTALEMASAELPTERKLDGKSLLPLLRGDVDRLDRDTLFWRLGTHWAVRSGSLKLIGFAGREQPLLVDLSSAEGESRDLAAARPRDVAALTRLYREWESAMVEPLWDSGGTLRISLDDVLAGRPIAPVKGSQPGTVELP